MDYPLLSSVSIHLRLGICVALSPHDQTQLHMFLCTRVSSAALGQAIGVQNLSQWPLEFRVCWNPLGSLAACGVPLAPEALVSGGPGGSQNLHVKHPPR